ncbi:uroporphyrinogen decarboxylase family protein [candidate division KSB1 bacterium]
MTSKERINLALSHKVPDMIPIHDTVWKTTEDRWHREGLPEHAAASEFFNYEIVEIRYDKSFQFKEEIVEEAEEYVIIKNRNGALKKDWKNAISTPEMIDFAIKTKDDWFKYKGRLTVNKARLVLDFQDKIYRAGSEKEKFICFTSGMGYDHTQQIIGSEKLLIKLVEDPEWVYDMFMTYADLIIQGVQMFNQQGYEFDGAFLFDDMGYRNTTLFSPKTYKEVLMPAHKKVVDFFKSKNMPVILHSCGCVKDFIPFFIELRIDCLQPLEVKAGMDLIELKRQYGKEIAFMGGIDVRKMSSDDPDEIEMEIKNKFEVAKQGGGYIYHSDHSIPDNVSFEQYKRVIHLVKKYGKY